MSRINQIDVNEFKEVKQRLRQAGKKKSDFRRLLLIVAIVAVFQLGIVGGILISGKKEPRNIEPAVAKSAGIAPVTKPEPKPAIAVSTPMQQGLTPHSVPVMANKPARKRMEREAARKEAPLRKTALHTEKALRKKKTHGAHYPARVRAQTAPLSIDVAGGDIGRAYAAGMRTIIERHKETPFDAAGNLLEGRCLIVCIIKRDGSLRHAEIIRTSGNPILDAAALRSVRKAGRFPMVPDAIPGEELSFDVPLTFRASGT